MNLATKIILSIFCVLILFMGGLTYLVTRWQRSAFSKSAHHYTNVLGETMMRRHGMGGWTGCCGRGKDRPSDENNPSMR